MSATHRQARRLLLLAAFVCTTPQVTRAHAFAPGVLSGSGLTPRLPPHCRDVTRPPDVSPATDLRTSWLVDCGSAGLHGHRLSMDGIEMSRTDVIVRITSIDDAAATAVLHRGRPDFNLPATAATNPRRGAVAVLASYFVLGTEHILLGYDHLLFVLGLLLLASGWRMLLETVTAFTVAHSLTLALAVLGAVQLPAAPVEVLIAASIVLLAAEVARIDLGYVTEASLTRRRPWVVALLFGLLHGLGFAGALAEIGLPREHLGLALLAFNLGVEAGQLAVVLALSALVLAARRVGWKWRWARLAPAYAMGVLAVAWTLERLTDLRPALGS
jgi:hydrogenase/urease accessory protein HupE